MTEFDPSRRPDGTRIAPERVEPRSALMTIGVLAVLVIAIATAIGYWNLGGGATTASNNSNGVTTGSSATSPPKSGGNAGEPAKAAAPARPDSR
jgi:hypothetical protein